MAELPAPSSPVSAGDRLRKLLPTLSLVTSPTKKRTKELTAATASMLSSMTSSTISMASQAGTALKDGTMSAVTKVTQDLSSLVVNSGQIVTIDAFREYLSAVDPIYDEFLKKQPVLKAPEKSSIPVEYFNSDYPQSGLLQHQILRQPLRRTVTYADKILEDLNICSDTVEALLLNHLEHFDQLLQGLESLTLLEQGLYSAISKIQQTRVKTGNILASDSHLKLYNLARRHARMHKCLVSLKIIDSLKTGQAAVLMAVSDNKYLEAVSMMRTLEVSLNKLPEIAALKAFKADLDSHWESLDKFLENDLLEKLAFFLVSQELPFLAAGAAPGVGGQPGAVGRTLGAASVVSDELQKLLEIAARRGLFGRVFGGALKEIVARRAKTRLRKASAFAAAGKLEISDEEIQKSISEMTAEKFKTFIAQVHDLVLKDFLLRVGILANFTDPQGADGLFLVALETGAMIDGRIAGLLAGVKLGETELFEMVGYFESRLASVHAQTSLIAKSLKQHSTSLVPDNVASELQKKARALFEVKLTAAVTELDTSLGKEKWEVYRGGVPAEVREFLRELSGRVSVPGDEESDEARKTLKIGRFVFVPVPSLMEIVKLVHFVYSFWRSFRLIGPDVLIRLDATVGGVNERIRDLVLGGQAVTEGIRQSITATNLSLAAQTCGALAALLPLVSNAILKDTAENPGFFLKLAGQNKLEAALEDLKFGTVEELNSHRAEVVGKIANILVDRFEQLNSLVLAGEDNTNKLCKDLHSMYKVLLKCQSPAETKAVFKTAFGVISAKFTDKLKSAARTRDPVKLNELHNRVPADLANFLVTLTTGDLAVAGVADVLEDAVRAMLDFLDACLPVNASSPQPNRPGESLRADLRTRLIHK